MNLILYTPQRHSDEVQRNERSRTFFTKSSTFTAGFGDEKRDLLFDLPAFALRTIDLRLVVVVDAVRHGEFTFAVLALIVVSGHNLISFSCRWFLTLH
jgi:hypothetical protein